MKPRLFDWIAFFKAHLELFQFGQTHDVSTFNGSTGCTHCYVQSMALALLGRFLTHDEISDLCGYPYPPNNQKMRGMRASAMGQQPEQELNICIRRLKLPLELHFFSAMTDKVWLWICERNNDGPIGVAVDYDWLPRAPRKGPGNNGIAEVGGATQIGLTGGHLDIRLGYDLRTDTHGKDMEPKPRWHDWWHDPDHASQARKERPAFDRFLSSQGRIAVESIQRVVDSNGNPRSIMVVTPSRPISPR